MPRELKETKQFKSDKKRIKNSGRYDWEKMRAVVKELMNDRPLAEKHQDHKLTGDYVGARECHVEPDWLLVYNKEDGENKKDVGVLNLIRTGSHSELF
jgi:mRNA interferase YafQ